MANIKAKIKAGSLSYYNDEKEFVTITKKDGLVEIPEKLYNSRRSMFENTEIETVNMISLEDHEKEVEKAVKKALKEADKQAKLDLGK